MNLLAPFGRSWYIPNWDIPLEIFHGYIYIYVFVHIYLHMCIYTYIHMIYNGYLYENIFIFSLYPNLPSNKKHHSHRGAKKKQPTGLSKFPGRETEARNSDLGTNLRGGRATISQVTWRHTTVVVNGQPTFFVYKDAGKLPRKLTYPWNSMVGRCISYWNSPFLGDMLVFGGVFMNMQVWLFWLHDVLLRHCG